MLKIPQALSTAYNGLLLTPRILKSSWQARSATQLEQAKNIDASRLANWLSIDVNDIEAVQWQNVHEGTTSRSRLLVRYRDPENKLPGSFFVKSTAPIFSTRVFGNLFELGNNECRFYRSIRPGLNIAAPEIYHINGDGTDFLLLLEDLAAEDCEFTDISSRCSLEQALAVATTLARLHGQFWQSPDFTQQLAWVPRYETDNKLRLMSLIRALSVDTAIKKYRDLVPDEVVAAVPLIMEKYPALEKQWSLGPRTLVHGDSHIGNMYFQRGELGLLDWQVLSYGQGMRDLAYFMVNSVPTDLRQQHQHSIIEHYLAVLNEHGGKLDFDQAWQQYRLHTFYTWISSVVTAAASHMQDPKIAAAGLSRSCKALLDLDTLALIKML